MRVIYWKFVDHEINFTKEDAGNLASKIEQGLFKPTNDYGNRYYKFQGYCFDLGRKPYLIEYAHGSIERKWASSVKELRECCYLKRGDKVVPDPFYKFED